MSKAIIILVSLILACELIQCESDKQSPVLQIANGQIKGRLKQFRGIEVQQYLCIPYGEPPIDKLRFKKPLPKSAWANVLPADEWGPYCLQPKYWTTGKGLNYSEDCLCLNVFTTSVAIEDAKQGNDELRPVMVWIHGGAFIFGSANNPDQFDGTALAALEDVVVVTINYRLGEFGFLHLPEAGVPGNMGLWDQQLALKWVQDNAKYFGGDQNKVTIFGESAGSISVSAHIVSPQSKGLFKNAIMQSGSIYDINRWTVKNLSQTFLAKIGCVPPNDINQCLSLFDYNKNPETQFLWFWPIVGDEFLPKLPEEIIETKGVDPSINVLLGTVGYEGANMIVMKDPITFHPTSPANLTLIQAKKILNHLLGPSSCDYFFEKYSYNTSSSDEIRLMVTKIIGDVILTCPTYVFGKDLVQKNGLSNVYAYYQSYKPTITLLGTDISKWIPASHGDDILLVFGHPLAEPEKYSSDDLILSHFMVNIWATFAKTGEPFSIGPHRWSKWTEKEDKVTTFTMELNPQSIGPIDGVVRPCLDNWPFPLEKPYNLNSEIGKLLELK
ncbi:acetylcholinesterase-1-like [Tetranychus urticae]|uniref:Carboxylic ester hydrolase n=1 Tax=Tetranychus urticae TaxID=32264 RepID=T1L430_TETUR|nr:acetylcholinesterase-1-like [Tetranychus urticae]